MHTKNRPYTSCTVVTTEIDPITDFFARGGATARFCGGKLLRAANVFFYGISVKHGRKGK